MKPKRRRAMPLHVLLDDHEQQIIDGLRTKWRMTKREVISRLLERAQIVECIAVRAAR